MSKRISVIGAAVVDILAGGVGKDIFTKGSVPAKRIQMSFGGDALNEAVVLSGLGMKTELISLVGKDEAGEKILDCLGKNKVSTRRISISDEISTAMNIVLVDEDGERSFVTDPKSSLRRLSKEHILPYCEEMGEIVSFASIFVSPVLDVSAMKEVFSHIKKDPKRILVADMTTAKNGEKIEDLAPLLGYIDYIIPNLREAEILTGEKSPEKAAEAFLNNGAENVIIKCGRDGCFFKNRKESGIVPAYKTKAIDTTGAGDSFVAGFIYGLAGGMETMDCCRFGNATASLMVENYGTQGIIGNPGQVLERYKTL